MLVPIHTEFVNDSRLEENFKWLIRYETCMRHLVVRHHLSTMDTKKILSKRRSVFKIQSHPICMVVGGQLRLSMGNAG